MSSSPPVYAVEADLGAAEFAALLVDSGLGAIRPVADLPRLDAMLRNASLVVTARLDGQLVGAARAISDGVFCCYLSDLAVGQQAQGHGVGAGLIDELKKQIGPQVSLVLLSVPEAVGFYQRIGMEQVASCFIHRRAH